MRIRIVVAFFVLQALAGMAIEAQSANRILQPLDSARVQVLPNHHPLWANAANSTGLVSPETQIAHITMVLSRTPEQEAALEKFLAEQQNPASPNFHHWLTPAEFGDRFGLSNADVGTMTGWLQSEGLHVNWVSPSRVFIDFGGSAGDVSRAFKTELRNYSVHGLARMSVSSDPMIPMALAPAVRAIRGLYTIDEQPQHSAEIMQSASPEMTLSNGKHFITPSDFYIIYGLPNGLTGAGVTIGIVGRARTNSADFINFWNLGGAVPIPTEIVPTAFGGVDPGPAYTAPPPSGTSTSEQGEATLDVLRAGSVAWGSQLLLVVATAASGGIEADAEYLVNTTPVPVQVMTISYGACESAAGPAGVNFWDALLQQGAAEGISTFVSSGDSGAAGCDAAFTAPPAVPKANSPNYICSSSYATCVGGTEFNDANGSYWEPYSPGARTTAEGYIPEGGWNESWDGTTSRVASSGGGVSSIVPTPSWQKGIPGVPSAQTGRYSPDISFSASAHDGYFACFAAGGGSCVIASDGSYYFTYFSGTSASAPSMAGIAALLDQYMAGAQGNLNPGIYQMWYGAPTAFHDVTVATSGVSSCNISTPSMCNNSIPGVSGLSGGQPGYAVGTGYDEVTGLGSLNAGTFVYAYGTSGKLIAPAITVYGDVLPVNQDISLNVNVAGGPFAPAPTGTLVLTAGSYTSAPVPVQNNLKMVIPVGTLGQGDYTVTVTYTPDAASQLVYTTSAGSGQLTVSAPQYLTPIVWLLPAEWTVLSSGPVSLPVSVRAPEGRPTPTGSVAMTLGQYTSSAVLAKSSDGGDAVFTIPASALTVGNDPLTVTYTPDSSAATLYTTAMINSYSFNVISEQVAPSLSIALSSNSITTLQTLGVSVGFSSSLPVSPSGTVTVTSGSYTSAPAPVGLLQASVTIPAGALAVGTDTLSVSYSGDSLFTPVSASASVVVAQGVPPSFALSGTPVSVKAGSTTGNTSTLTVTPSGGFTGTVGLSAAITSKPAGAQYLPTVSTSGAVLISGSSAGTGILTITTSAATKSALSNPGAPKPLWRVAGGAVLACILIWVFPSRHRRWSAMLALLALIALSGGALACGGSGGSSGGGGASQGSPGTTPGAYVVTVTGTWSTTTSTCTVNVTVQ